MRLKVLAVGSVAYTGKSVAAWLNDPVTPTRERIITLLREMAALLALPDHSDAAEQAIGRIDELLKPYIWRQHFFTKQGGRLIGFAASATSLVDDAELLSAKCISDLAEQGLATGIRQCRRCLRWFFTARLRKKFWCSDGCHAKWVQEDPAQKLKHAERQKKHYHKWLSADVRGRSRKAKSQKTKRRTVA